MEPRTGKGLVGWGIFILCFGACSPLIAAKYARYESWRETDEPWIRVGLKKPARVIRLSSQGTILVLDGHKVVRTIEPGGEFLIIHGKGKKKSGYWIQDRAARRESALQKTKTELSGKYPDTPFIITRATSRFKALRAGPFTEKAEAEAFRTKMVAEGFKDAFRVGGGRSRYQWVDRNFDKFELRSDNLALVRADPNLPIQYQGTAYRGILRFRITRGKIRVINELPLETYLRGVVPSELGPRVYPELEAQKAQAVAARTYVLKNLGRFENRGYDICDGPACQAYDGRTNEMALSDEAVKATRGLVLFYGDELIDALYTSTSGGATDDVENMFPGRAEPYLRGKSDYLANFKSWTLPKRAVDRAAFAGHDEHLAFHALLYGFPSIPDFSGALGQQDLQEALAALKWVLGPPPPVPKGSKLSYGVFWETLARFPFFLDSADHQVLPPDTDRILRQESVPDNLRTFTAFLLRYGLIPGEMLASFNNDEPIPKAEAYAHLFHFCRALGPEPEWRKYRLLGMDSNKLQVRRGLKPSEIDLASISCYVVEKGGRMVFMEQPILEDLDRVFTLMPPFPANILRVRQSGGVASVDRFSAFDFWMEKKDVKTLEKRARRYVRGLRGIKEIKILERSQSGRVALMEYITEAGDFKVKGLKIRRSLGVRDNLFDILPSYRNGRLVHVTIVGRGWGHGVGMSQVGAFGLARMGWTFEEILQYYYTDVEIRPYDSKASAAADKP